MPNKTGLFAKRSCIVCLLFLLLTYGVRAQNTITGKVLGRTDNQPIAGATVQIKGTKSATQTIADGSFSLDVPGGKGVVVISFVGFENAEITLTGASNLGTILLTTSTATLNQVFVTGYTAQRKKDITGAVSVVNVDDLKSMPSGSTESLLQGQASGVTVFTTGAPGGASVVQIRGITSTGNSAPLVIIDGVPASLHDINVNDIQSVQVLKDAGAASIYGVRGSNGVIIVTSKKGGGKFRISYDAMVGTQQPLAHGWKLANPTQTGQAKWLQYENDGLVPSDKQYGNGAQPVVPDYITPTGSMAGAPGTDPSTYALYTNQITLADKGGNDWFHDIFKPASMTDQNISVSGGTEKSSFLFAFNYFSQDGTLIDTKLQRYSARVNSVFSLFNDHVRIGENLFAFYKSNPGYLNAPGVNNANSISAAYQIPNIIPVYDIMGNYAGTGSAGLGNSPQPVAIQNRQANNKNQDYEIYGNAFAELDFLRHFTVRTSIGGTVNYFFNNAFIYTAYENAENNTNANSYQEQYGWNSSTIWTNSLKYNNVWDKHNLTVLGGTEYITNSGRAVGTTRGNYYITDSSNLTVSPNLWTLNFGNASTQTNQNLIVTYNGLTAQTPYQFALFSLFGRLDYQYNDKYLFSTTIRRDGSSVFSPSQRYGIFPSFTAGWRISRESFLQNVSWLDELKIRGGWGKLGSISNINPTNAYTLFGQVANQSYYDINGTSTSPAAGLYTQQYGNPNTSWEKDITTNIGIDATILHNRIDLSIEWYKKLISGLLFVPQVPGTNGGASDPFLNSGDISNTGIDFAITYHGNVHNVGQHDLHFDITGTLTSYKNKVVSLPPGTQYIDIIPTGGGTPFSRLQVGQAAGAFFGYKVIGLFQNWADVQKSPKQDAAAPGRFKYADVNHDNVIDANDRTFFGNPNPKFTTGLNIGVSYRNFDFYMFLYASVGNDILNDVKNSTDFPQGFGNQMSENVAVSAAKIVNSSGQPTNVNDPTAQVANPGTNVPALEVNANFSNSTAFNSYTLESGSYLRCRTITLGYNFISPELRKLHFDRLRVYFQVLNLFTVTKYSGLDPQVNPGTNVLFGIDGGAYPNNQKSYNLGVNVTLL